MKTPDQWERMVDAKSLPGGVLAAEVVVKLLRQEHWWVRRMVKELHQPLAEPGSVNYGYNQAVAFILEKLQERAK